MKTMCRTPFAQKYYVKVLEQFKLFTEFQVNIARRSSQETWEAKLRFGDESIQSTIKGKSINYEQL